MNFRRTKMSITCFASKWAGVGEYENYCRNPSMDAQGPWCYVEDENIKNETCGIPRCQGNKET